MHDLFGGRQYDLNPLNPSISMHILLTVQYTFSRVLTGEFVGHLRSIKSVIISFGLVTSTLTDEGIREDVTCLSFGGESVRRAFEYLRSSRFGGFLTATVRLM